MWDASWQKREELGFYDDEVALQLKDGVGEKGAVEGIFRLADDDESGETTCFTV